MGENLVCDVLIQFCVSIFCSANFTFIWKWYFTQFNTNHMARLYVIAMYWPEKFRNFMCIIDVYDNFMVNANCAFTIIHLIFLWARKSHGYEIKIKEAIDTYLKIHFLLTLLKIKYKLLIHIFFILSLVLDVSKTVYVL